ncbi:MAG: hypothetical protein NTV79_01895 [Candidatus Aureabacteria bacterium]|nr:hypothetical protein [Candidatus Auribacterota bacterium]
MKTNRVFIAGLIASFLLAAQMGRAQQTQEVILPAFKPTIKGHANNALVKSVMGSEKKEMVVFWKKDSPEFTLAAALGGTFLGGSGFQVGAEGEKIGLDETQIAIEGDTAWQFVGNLDYEDSTYTFIGTVRLLKHTFVSSETAPLVFKLVKDKGFVYLKGTGKVTTPEGKTMDLGGTPAKLRAGDPETTTEKTVQVVILKSGSMTYELALAGSNSVPVAKDEYDDVGFVLGANQYRDQDMACAFSKDNDNALGIALWNLSSQKIVVHWGSDEKKITVGEETLVPMVFMPGPDHPFLGGGVQELKEDMVIEPRRSAFVFITSVKLLFDQGKLAARQELLPREGDKAKQLVGKPLTILLPLTVGDQTIKKTIQLTILNVK